MKRRRPKSTPPRSLAALAKFTWEEFEDFALSVLRKRFGIHGIKLIATPRMHDGGRDGESTFVIEQGVLELRFKLWVEIKQRSVGNLGRKDLGGHLVAALIHDVNKILLVTNQSFTKSFHQDVAAISVRTGLKYGLIDGPALLELSASVASGMDASRSHDVVVPQPASDAAEASSDFKADRKVLAQVCASFNADPRFNYGFGGNVQLTVSVDEPVFLGLDFVVKSTATSKPMVVRLKPRDPEAIHVQEYRVSRLAPTAPGDLFRMSYVLRFSKPGIYDLHDLGVVVSSGNVRSPTTLDIVGRESCRVLPNTLRAWRPPSRERLWKMLCERVAKWRDDGGMMGVGLIASAGMGKSYLVNALRWQWLEHGVSEIRLDGETAKTGCDLVRAIVEQVFPIPGYMLSELSRTDIAMWLSHCGLTATLAERIACYLHGSTDMQAISTRELAEMLAYVVARAASENPVVLLFEDLHKAAASGLALYADLKSRLQMLRKAPVLCLVTSRTMPSQGDTLAHEDWCVLLRELTNEHKLIISPFSDEEAIGLLHATLPMLERHHLLTIVDQVGRSPLGLREAIGFMIAKRIIRKDVTIDEYLLNDVDALGRSLDLDDFRQATGQRLGLLRQNSPEWLSNFVDAAACLGRAFSVSLCLDVAGVFRSPDVSTILDVCAQEHVFRVSRSDSDEATFDHDIIRQVALNDIGEFRHRTIASMLYERLADYPPSVRCSVAYQAGKPDDCAKHAKQCVTAALSTHQYVDAQAFLGLLLLVTDINVADRVFGRARVELSGLDIAVAIAERCVRRDLSDSERQHEVLELLMELAKCITTIGGGVSANGTISEAMLLARRLRDDECIADLTALHGRAAFENDDTVGSLGLHEQAEKVYASLAKHGRSLQGRSANLLRLAIAERQLGDRETSRRTLVRAARLKSSRDWSLITRIRLNYGATYFSTDWTETRRHWEHALRTAFRRSDSPVVAHCLIDVGHLDLLENRARDALGKLTQAQELSEKLGLDNSLLRSLMNLAVIEMLDRHYDLAHEFLARADAIGLSHRIGRRLWRVQANMATLYELMGKPKKCYSWDKLVLGSIGIEEGNRPELPVWLNTRRSLPLVNICLRAQSYDEHSSLVALLPPSLRRAVEALMRHVVENRLESMPSLLGRHCRHLDIGSRFILTE